MESDPFNPAHVEVSGKVSDPISPPHVEVSSIGDGQDMPVEGKGSSPISPPHVELSGTGRLSPQRVSQQMDPIEEFVWISVGNDIDSMETDPFVPLHVEVSSKGSDSTSPPHVEVSDPITPTVEPTACPTAEPDSSTKPVSSSPRTPPHLRSATFPSKDFFDSVTRSRVFTSQDDYDLETALESTPHTEHESVPVATGSIKREKMSTRKSSRTNNPAVSKMKEVSCSKKAGEAVTPSKQGLKKKEVPSSGKKQEQGVTPSKQGSKRKEQEQGVTPSKQGSKRKEVPSSVKKQVETPREIERVVSMKKEDSAGQSVENIKKRKKTRAEVVEQVIKEEEETHDNAEEDNSLNLFNFLYENSGESDSDTSMVEDFDLFFKMFNPVLDIDEIIRQGFDYVEPFFTKFLNLVSDQLVNVNGSHYIHLTSVGNKNSSARRAIARRINLLPSSATLALGKFPFHKGVCRVVEKLVAFVCYLASLGNTEEEKALKDEFDFDRIHREKKDEEEELVEEEKIELTTEEKREIRFQSVKEQLQEVDEDNLNDSHIAIPTLPTFSILEKEFVLLNDIQALFNLREDYCLDLIAQQKQEEEEWVLEDPKLECLNTCFDPNRALELCFEEAIECKPTATDEEFLDMQRLIRDPRTQQLLIEEQCKLEESISPQKEVVKEINKSPVIVELEDVSPPPRGKTFINLWMDGLLEYDENSQLYVEIDEFLGRRGGVRKRRKAINTDSSLMNYIKALPKSRMYIVHAKYSNDAYLKILTFKTLSKFLGGYQMRTCVNKIILVEKNMAIDIFGFAPGHPRCRVGYFLSYTAYALALGIQDPKLLTGYGKSYMVTYREREPKDEENVLEYAIGKS